MSDFAKIRHPDFQDKPYWWEAAAPNDALSGDLPAQTEVLIVGAGYGGLNAALELARNGREAVVCDAEQLGWGASSRNGGGVSAGTNLGKGISGTPGQQGDDADGQAIMEALLAESMTAYEHLADVIAREEIDCYYEEAGRFVGAYTPAHYNDLAKKLDMVETHTGQGLELLPPERQREAIGSDFYYGGMLVRKAAKLHPALYHHGMLNACHAQGVRMCSRTRVLNITGKQGAFTVTTDKGVCRAEQIVIASNGYTDRLSPKLRKRLVPVASHIIATEELPDGLCEELFPGGRNISETPRILHYYRPCPEMKRVIFGGRAKFTDPGVEVVAPILHTRMVERFPELAGIKITHAWSGNVAFTMDHVPHMGLHDGRYYCAGCNGSGVAMLSYLGYLVGRQIVTGDNHQTAYMNRPFRKIPLPFYNGHPWFLPMLGSYYQFLDRRERKAAR